MVAVEEGEVVAGIQTMESVEFLLFSFSKAVPFRL